MYFKCNYCGKEGTGMTFVNGFNMCPMCAEFEKENEQLKQQLAEKDKLLKNAIVPKFKLNEIVYYYEEHLQGKIVSIGYANKGQGLTYFYYNIKPLLNGTPMLNTNCIELEEKFIYTQAEEALKKLNKE